MLEKVKVPNQSGDISQSTSLIAMVLILIMTFAIGANGLNKDSIWTDELTSLANMGAFDPPYSPIQIIDSIADKSSQHVPLFFFIGAMWANVAGWSQVSMRILSLFFGVMLVAWTYRFGVDLVNRKTGSVSALLLGSSAFVLVYFHEIRMYSLLMLMAVMHMRIYWQLVHKGKQSRVIWFGFIVTTIALLYTHVFSSVIFAGLGIYHLIFVSKSRLWFKIILGWGVGALVFVPYLPIVIRGFTVFSNNPAAFVNALSTPELLETFGYLVSNGMIGLWILFVSALIYGLWKKPNQHIVRVLIVTTLMFLTLVFINHRFGLIPLTQSRYLLIIWSPMIVLFAYSLTIVRNWKIVTGIVIFVWFVSGYNLYYSPTFIEHTGSNSAVVQYYPPMQDYVAYLKDKVRPLDYIVGFTMADFVNRPRKHGKSAGDYYTEAQLGIDGTFIPNQFNREQLLIDIPEDFQNYADILLTYHPSDLPQNLDLAISVIEDTYVACDVVVDEENLFVQRYVHSVLDCDRAYAPIHYDNGVTILDKYIDYSQETDSVHVFTAWKVSDERLLDEYNVSIQIVTADWQNVGQVDRHLYDDILPWYHAELPTDQLASGDYRVMVIVYDRYSNQKVDGTDILTNETATILPIAIFTVEESFND